MPDERFPYSEPRIPGVDGFFIGGPGDKMWSGRCLVLHEYTKRCKALEEETGDDYCGHLSKLLNDLIDRHNHNPTDTELYFITPFCWCDSESCELCNGEKPYFTWKPTGFQADFYKHPGRSLRANKPWNVADIEAMRTACGLEKEP